MTNSWQRMMAPSWSMVQAGLRALETRETVHKGIAARAPIINPVLPSPLTADYEELGIMAPEKVEAR